LAHVIAEPEFRRFLARDMEQLFVDGGKARVSVRRPSRCSFAIQARRGDARKVVFLLHFLRAAICSTLSAMH